MLRRVAGVLALLGFLGSSNADAGILSRVVESIKGPAKEEVESVPSWGDPVTVVASRLPSFSTPPEDIPANVTLKKRGDTELRYARTFQESLQDIDGIHLYDAVGNGADTTLSMRGFSEGSAVTVLLDGVRVNELDGDALAYPLLSLEDVESIQVERGSASPVYGSGSFAGVVNIKTGRASEKPVSLFGGSEWTSFHGIRFYQGVSGTLEDKATPLGGKFQYYFKGGRSDVDGFRENGEVRMTNFDFKAAYLLPDDTGKFEIGIKHRDDAISNPGELTLQQFHDRPWTSNKPLDGRKYKTTILQMNAEKKFWDERVFVSAMTNWRLNQQNFYATTATFTDFTSGSNPDTDFVTQKTRATDFIGQAGYEDRWDWLGVRSLIGLEMRDGTEYSREQDAFGGQVRPSAVQETDRNSQPESFGLFWQQRGSVHDKVIAHVGMRHDFHKLEISDALTPANSLSKRWRDSSLSTGVTIKPVSWSDIFANYSQGFRVPTISELVPFSSAVNPNLLPEHIDSYETGLRLRYHEKARMKFSYFLSDLSDEIVFDSTSVTTTTPFGSNINVGKSRRDGVETVLEAKPFREWTLYGTHTWTRAVVRETDAGGSLVDGRGLGQIPQNRFTLGTMFQPFLRHGEVLSGFKIGLNGVFVGKQHPTTYESASQSTLNSVGDAGHLIKRYTVWNFLLSYAWREKEVYFRINNLFDERYYSRAVSATSFGTAIYPSGTYSFVNPGAPREFVAGFKWLFE